MAHFTGNDTVVVVPQITEKIVEKQVEVDRNPCLNNRDCFLLAEAIYHEARGEPSDGQVAVANVIVNRVNSNYFPDSVEGVLRQGCQFSYRCDGSVDRGINNLTAFQRAMMVAKGVLQHDRIDPTNGADHYLNPAKVKSMPHWTTVYDQVAVMGNHQFHKRG